MAKSENIDDTDRLILKTLREDSRTAISELARLTSMTRTSCRQRIQKLERMGYIENYTISGKGDLHLSRIKKYMFISLIKIDDDVMTQVENFLKSHASVVFSQLMEGDYDYLVGISDDKDDTIKDLIRDIRKMSGISRTRTSTIIEGIIP